MQTQVPDQVLVHIWDSILDLSLQAALQCAPTKASLLAVVPRESLFSLVSVSSLCCSLSISLPFLDAWLIDLHLFTPQD